MFKITANSDQRQGFLFSGSEDDKNGIEGLFFIMQGMVSITQGEGSLNY